MNETHIKNAIVIGSTALIAYSVGDYIAIRRSRRIINKQHEGIVMLKDMFVRTATGVIEGRIDDPEFITQLQMDAQFAMIAVKS